MYINKCTLTDSFPIHITLKEVADYTLKVLWQIVVHTAITKNWMWIIWCAVQFISNIDAQSKCSGEHTMGC